MQINQKVLFNKKECDSIICYSKISNKEWKTNDRKYNSQTIEYTNETEWIFEKLKLYFESITKISITNLKKEIHFHKFNKDDWFGKHNDSRDNRLYAVGVLLNDNFIGGDFKLYNDNEITLNKIRGNTYIFDVRIEHEITSILEGERYSLLWFLQNEHILLKRNNLI